MNARQLLVFGSLVGLTACPSTPPATSDGGADAGSTLMTCGGEIVDIRTSNENCGGCGLACDAATRCAAGACQPADCVGAPCEQLQVCYLDRCVDRLCLGVGCPAGEACAGGVCLRQSCSGQTCAANEVCSSDQCVERSCAGVLCPSGSQCARGSCFSQSCSDGILAGDETDVDCGGSCAPCVLGQRCVQAGDCLSHACNQQVCGAAPACSDGQVNGAETDVDCGGGSCGPCADGKGCVAYSDCTSLVCDNAHCQSAAPTRLEITSAPQTLLAGVCSAPFTLQLRDANQPVGAPAPMAVTLGAAAGVTFFGDATCAGSPVTTVGLPAGASTASVRFRATGPGMPVLMVSAAGLTPASQQQTITAGPASKLAFSNASLTAEAGACSAALVVTVQDGSNNPTLVGADTMVMLDISGPGPVQISTDAACAVPGAARVISPGGGSATFYFTATTPGSYTATATSSPTLTAASQGETVTPPAPKQLKIISAAAASVTSGACSPQVTVQTRDAAGSPLAVTAAQGSVAVTPSGPGFGFFSDPGCTAPIGSVNIAAGSQTATFYFKPSAPIGVQTLTVAANGLSGDTQAQNLVAGTAAKWGMTSTPVNVIAGACSGRVGFEIEDAAGNPVVLTANTSVTLAGGASVTYYSNATCATPIAGLTLGSGSSGGGFYFKTNVVQTLSVQVSGGGYVAATQSWTVVAGPPVKTIISPATVTLLASTCSPPNTVTLQDAWGNLATGPFTVLLVSSAPSQTFYSDASCTTPVTSVTIPAGASSATFYWKMRSGGAATVTGSGAGITAAATQAVTSIPTVRSGTFSFSFGSGSSTATISPPLADLSKAFFFFQVTNTTTGDNGANTRCSLTNTSTISCAVTYSSGTTNVAWQVVELPGGVNVQHLNPACAVSFTTGSSATQTVALPAPVNPSSTFVLFSSRMQSTTFGQQDARAYKAVKLTSPTTVDIVYSDLAPCSAGESVALQVVELAGATVTRGTTSINAGAFSSTAMLPSSDPSSSFLLYSYRMAPGLAPDCNNGVRGALDAAGNAVFTRGAGSTSTACATTPIDELSFQRVVLPPGNVVQPRNATVASGSSSVQTALVTQVDRTRTVAFAGGQNTCGQLSGETDSSTNSDSRASRALQVIDPTATQLVTTRTLASGNSQWAAFVVQWLP